MKRVLFSCRLDDADEKELPSSMVAESVTLQEGVTVPLNLAGRTRFHEHFLDGYPILWVQDHDGALWPYWLDNTNFLPVRNLLSGRSTPKDLPVRLHAKLAAVGALVETSQTWATPRS